MIYVVTAYRWGWRNGHSYVVGAFSSLELAKKAADSHVDYRGGKYGCEVAESALDEGDEDKIAQQVYYAESPYYGRACCSEELCDPADKSKLGWSRA